MNSYLAAADREERGAESVHEADLAGLIAGNVVVNPKYEISACVKDGESVAVEDQRLLPHGEHRRIRFFNFEATARLRRLRRRRWQRRR